MALVKINETYPQARCGIRVFSVREIIKQELIDLPSSNMSANNIALFQKIANNMLYGLDIMKAKIPALIKFTPIYGDESFSSHYFICELDDFEFADSSLRLENNIKE